MLAAQDLLTFFQRLWLDAEARCWEPKTLRHRLLHVAGRVARSGRRVFLRLQRSWRWVSLLAAAFGGFAPCPPPDRPFRPPPTAYRPAHVRHPADIRAIAATDVQRCVSYVVSRFAHQGSPTLTM